MAEPRTAREIAETIILSHTEDIEWGSINEMTEDEFDALGEEAHEALCREVDALISLATVTVTFPGDQDATVQAQLLRAFADQIDQGPDVPLPPSIYSAMARETADNLDAQPVSEADHG